MNTLKQKAPFLYNVVRKLAEPYVKYVVAKNAKKRNDLFKQNALSVFSDFCSVLSENGIQYWLDYGTLLGAVREHDFIAHDYDIDLGVFYDQDLELMIDKLKAAGFSLYRRIDVYSKEKRAEGVEFTFEKESVKIDVFSYVKEIEDLYYTYEFLDSEKSETLTVFKTVRKTILPIDGLQTYNFVGINVLIPSNYDSYLKKLYGESYMIPDPSWKSTDYYFPVLDGVVGIIRK